MMDWLTDNSMRIILVGIMVLWIIYSIFFSENDNSFDNESLDDDDKEMFIHSHQDDFFL